MSNYVKLNCEIAAVTSRAYLLHFESFKVWVPASACKTVFRGLEPNTSYVKLAEWCYEKNVAPRFEDEYKKLKGIKR